MITKGQVICTFCKRMTIIREQGVLTLHFARVRDTRPCDGSYKKPCGCRPESCSHKNE